MKELGIDLNFNIYMIISFLVRIFQQIAKLKSNKRQKMSHTPDEEMDTSESSPLTLTPVANGGDGGGPNDGFKSPNSGGRYGMSLRSSEQRKRKPPPLEDSGDETPIIQITVCF
jgi:hypothetical protein